MPILLLKLAGMNLIYAKKTEDRVIEFHINDTIGDRINGAYIESDMSFINMNKLADRINFRINSEGGSVLEGVKIISAILKSDIPVHTYNDGIAMSMGMYIWLAAKKENRHMVSFGSNMIHAARFVDDETGEMVITEDPEANVYLNVLNKMLADITQGATGKSKEDVLKLMAKDTFLNSEETYQHGLINKENIIAFEDMPQFKSEASISEKIKSIAAFYKKQNTNTMTSYKTVAAQLELQADASENSIVNAISAIKDAKAKVEKDLGDAQAKISAKDKKIGELEASIADYKNKEKELQKTMIKAEVSEAIKAGKFKEEDRDELEAMAIENPKMFKTFVAKAQVQKIVEAPDIAAKLTGDDITAMAAKYGVPAADMNYWDLWQNHASVLARLEAEAPKFYSKLKKDAEV